MKLFSLLILWALSFTIFSVKSSAQSSADAFEAKPSWEEHFNGKGCPNESYWTISKTYTKQHLARYVEDPQNVYVKRGKLHLVLRQNPEDTSSYISGRIVSKRTFSCGKLEFRAKCPVSKGVWNAIWLRDASKEKCRGEIDILEQIGCWGKEKYQLNFHLWGKFGGKSNNHQQNQRYANIDVSDFHIYTLEWYEERFVALVDGQEVCRFSKDEIKEWPFNHDYHMIIALAYGGNWAGACGTDDAALPQTLQVDWIKYYELKKKAR